MRIPDYSIGKIGERQDSNAPVRLKSVEIKNLFNTFNYRFDYENERDVSIVIAPNGCGKTTIFKFIRFILSPTLDLLQQIIAVPYDSFMCELSNGVRVGVEKMVSTTTTSPQISIINGEPVVETVATGVKCYNIIYRIVDENGKEFEFNFKDEVRKIIEDIRQPIHDAVSDPDWGLYDRDYYDYRILRWFLMSGIPESYIERISNMTTQKWVESVTSKEKQSILWRIWGRMLSKLCRFKTHYLQNYPEVCFINANRIETAIESPRDDDIEDVLTSFIRDIDESEIEENNPLDQINTGVRRRIGWAMSEYERGVVEAKNSLPKRYLSSNSADLKEEDFFREWKEYSDELREYRDFGLLSSEAADLEIEDLETAYKSKPDFLQIYLSEYRETLAPIRKIYSKLKQFASIIDSRNKITRKVLKFNINKGMYIECDGKEVPLYALSSGEQNDLIMFYRLIFETQNNRLILVDEPEISLHIEWQEEYIDKLLEICKETKSQAIVATHSPNIIKRHLDLCAKREMTYEKR